MPKGGTIQEFRRRRSAIGLIAACGLLLNLLLAGAFGSQAPGAAGSFDAYLAQHICTTVEDTQQRQDPAKQTHHDPDCPLCGTACPMGGCAPVGATVAKADILKPAGPVAEVAFRTEPEIRTSRALYPSDAMSQAPPLTA